MKKILVCLFFAAFSLNAFANDWTVAFGVNSSSNRSNPPSGDNKINSDTASASLTKKVDSKTHLGGIFTYAAAKSSSDINQVRSDNKASAVNLFSIHDIGSLRFVDFSVGYGSILIDGSNVNQALTFDTDSNFWSTGIGITQYVPITQSFFASFNGRTNFTTSKTDDYVDNSGERHASAKNSRTTSSIGAALNWQLGAWSPSVRASYVHSNRVHTVGLTDQDFYRYSVTTGYQFTKSTKLNFGYATVLNKSSNKEDSFQVSISNSF